MRMNEMTTLPKNELLKRLDLILRNRNLYLQQEDKSDIQKEQIARFKENQQERNAKKDS